MDSQLLGEKLRCILFQNNFQQSALQLNITSGTGNIFPIT